METFIKTIDFGNGFFKILENAVELEKAKEMAYELMSYTQENVSLHDENGNMVAESKWYGVAPTAEDFEDGSVLCHFGSYGFYSTWQEPF